VAGFDIRVDETLRRKITNLALGISSATCSPLRATLLFFVFQFPSPCQPILWLGESQRGVAFNERGVAFNPSESRLSTKERRLVRQMLSQLRNSSVPGSKE